MVCILGLAALIVSLWDKFATPTFRPLRAGVFVAMGLSSKFLKQITFRGWGEGGGTRLLATGLWSRPLVTVIGHCIFSAPNKLNNPGIFFDEESIAPIFVLRK